jgi:DNA-binding phage protein
MSPARRRNKIKVAQFFGYREAAVVHVGRSRVPNWASPGMHLLLNTGLIGGQRQDFDTLALARYRGGLSVWNSNMDHDDNLAATGAVSTYVYTLAREGNYSTGDTLTSVRIRVFLDVLARTGNLSVAAKLTGMSRDAHYKRLKRENDPAGEYRKAYENAREDFRDGATSRGGPLRPAGH